MPGRRVTTAGHSTRGSKECGICGKMNERIMDGVVLAFMRIDEEAKIKKEIRSKEEKQLKLAEERLQTIESEDRLGDSTIVKDWIRLAQE
ncbi:hypothetical protein PABG_12457 [Paracoccidioides brasiliensis Pb03]|nr:hypothetical protein PABG_12457 [Paracoccidioides brasiliensis Pb03]